MLLHSLLTLSSPSSLCLWLCKSPWFCPAIPLCVFPKDATGEVCADVWASGLPAGGGRLWEWRWWVLRSGEPLKRHLGREYTFCAEVKPVWLLWLCWPEAETQLKEIFLRSNVYWGHHVFWCMNSYWKTATYIHLSACGQYQNKPRSSPGRDLHTGDSLCRVLQRSLGSASYLLLSFLHNSGPFSSAEVLT